VPGRITIATTLLEGQPLPHNVAAGPMSADEFYTATAEASVVVVPLASGRVRAAGLLTYLNAMALGKLVIASDSLGVRDYVEHRRTGLIVPENDPQALAETLRWALHPDNEAEVQRLAENARERVLKQYTVDRYLDSLLGVAEEAMEVRDRRGPRRSRRYVRAAERG
jgi:glycosyltransferase involved in cell wall biosynthesis